MRRLVCALITLLLVSSLAHAAGDPQPAPILQGRPDSTANSNDPSLGPAFESVAAGISLRPPSGMTRVARGMGGEDIVVQYVNEANKWIFKVSRLALSKPSPLVTDRDVNGNVVAGANKIARQGILDLTADQIKM